MAHSCEPSRMIFVGGLQRSGTTLVGSLLSAHSDVAGLVNTPTRENEGQFLQDVYPTDHDLGMKRGNLRGAVMRWAYSPAAHLTEMDARAMRHAGERLSASWAPYWSKHEAFAKVEKSPSNLLRTRFLQEVFPDSRFVIVMRHPVVQALAVRKWGTLPMKIGLRLDRVIDHWLSAMETLAEDRPYVTNCLVMAYEDLVLSPDHTLLRLQRFCGLPPEHLPTQHISGSNSDYARYWYWLRRYQGTKFESLTYGSRLRDRVYRGLERAITSLIGPAQARGIEAQFGGRMARFGYTFESLETNLGWQEGPCAAPLEPEAGEDP